MKSICFTITCASGPSSARPIAANCSGVGVRLAEKWCKTVIDVRITRHDPGVQIRIPMDWRFGAQSLVKRIRIREDLGIEELDRDLAMGFGVLRHSCVIEKNIFHLSFGISHLSLNDTDPALP